LRKRRERTQGCQQGNSPEDSKVHPEKFIRFSLCNARIHGGSPCPIFFAGRREHSRSIRRAQELLERLARV
jgi:hypothetical protein